MVFLILFIILLVLSFIELLTKQKFEILFKCLFAVITLLAVFRFGVGTDYFTYMQWFNLLPKFNSPSFFTSANAVHGEIGFKILISLFKTLGLNFYIFMFVFSLITMCFFYMYINRQSKLKITSLFIFYSNLYYFSYVNGQIREAFTLGFFLAILLPLLRGKKYFRYFIYTLLLSSIHTSILVVLILPFIFFKFNTKTLAILILNAVLINILGLDLLKFVLPGYIYNAVAYYGVGSADFYSILSRLTFLAVILLLLKGKMKSIDDWEKKMLRYYLFGILFYFAFYNMVLVSSRTSIYFKAFEIVLIPNFYSLIDKKVKKVLMTYVICILISFMWYKEIRSQLSLGMYYNSTNVLKYDYVSIFNKNDILKYRPTIDQIGRGVESY